MIFGSFAAIADGVEVGIVDFDSEVEIVVAVEVDAAGCGCCDVVAVSAVVVGDFDAVEHYGYV